MIRQAVRTVADGSTYADPKVAGKLVALAGAAAGQRVRSTSRFQEMRVLELLPRG